MYTCGFILVYLFCGLGFGLVLGFFVGGGELWGFFLGLEVFFY